MRIDLTPRPSKFDTRKPVQLDDNPIFPDHRNDEHLNSVCSVQHMRRRRCPGGVRTSTRGRVRTRSAFVWRARTRGTPARLSTKRCQGEENRRDDKPIRRISQRCGPREARCAINDKERTGHSVGDAGLLTEETYFMPGARN